MPRTEVDRFQNNAQEDDCRDLWSLVILPAEYESQRRVLEGVGGNLRLDGKQLTWADIWKDNRIVRLRKTGAPLVRNFPTKCLYCQRAEER